MDSDNLSYQKKPGTIPLRKPVALVSSKYQSQGTHGTIIPYSKEHTKGEAVLVPAIVYVLSGGTTREKLYFKALMNDKILSSCVQVLFQSKEGQGLQPYQMNDIWQQGRKRGKITVEGKGYRLCRVDKVFLVTDVDEFESQLTKILSQKTKDDYGQWIISNPCIEIWLYYCFKRELAPELLKLRYVARSRRSQRLKQLNNNLITGGTDPRKAFDNTLEGIRNCKEHYRIGHYGIPKFLATSFHLMMEQIQTFIIERGRSFEAYQEAKRKEIETFLKGKNVNDGAL